MRGVILLFAIAVVLLAPVANALVKETPEQKAERLERERYLKRQPSRTGTYD